jgi:HemY protein
VLLALVWLVLRLVGLLVAVLRFLNGDETAISRYFDRNRERKGYEALADGHDGARLGRGAAGHVEGAKAERYLGRPELTEPRDRAGGRDGGRPRKAEEVYKRCWPTTAPASSACAG